MEAGRTVERARLVAPCGTDCGICELHVCQEDAALRERLIARGVRPEKLPCPGCREIKGACPVIGAVCETWACSTTHGVESCHLCTDFPCTRLAPAADRANVLPHNMKVYNLCVVAHRGVGALVQESAGLRQRYYQGRMEIGKGPQLSP